MNIKSKVKRSEEDENETKEKRRGKKKFQEYIISKVFFHSLPPLEPNK
jgi:hypothetical protein